MSEILHQLLMISRFQNKWWQELEAEVEGTRKKQAKIFHTPGPALKVCHARVLSQLIRRVTSRSSSEFNKTSIQQLERMPFPISQADDSPKVLVITGRSTADQPVDIYSHIPNYVDLGYTFPSGAVYVDLPFLLS